MSFPRFFFLGPSTRVPGACFGPKWPTWNTPKKCFFCPKEGQAREGQREPERTRESQRESDSEPKRARVSQREPE